MELHTDFIITLVKERPVLWDKTMLEYRDKSLTKEAWNDICRVCNNDWDNLSYNEKHTYGEYMDV